MSQPLKFHLFNCDNIYELSVVEDLLKKAKAKLGFKFSVDKHIFTLSEMTELSTKTIPDMKMDFAIFVVHANESVLAINNDDLEHGYAKVYRALMAATGGNVIVVIGGDDHYKDETEKENSVISRWAWRKIAHSQFKEEFIDGRKSFVFSWNEKHRVIHEEALLHYFDPSKKGQKFEYQPPQEPSRQTLTLVSNAVDGDPVQQLCSGVSCLEMGKEMDSKTEARPKESNASTSCKDLAVIGWQAKPEWMLAAEELIAKNKKDLNLAEDSDIFSDDEVTKLTWYLQNNALKFCVLLVDAEKVGAAMKSPLDTEAEYWKLQETAERNVARKIIIIVCYEWSFSQQEEEVIDWKIKSKFKEKDKVYITTFKKGKIALEPKHFVQLIMSSIPSTNPEPPERRGAHQIPALGPTQHPLGPQSPYHLYPTFPADNQCYPHPQGIVTNQPSYPAGASHLGPALAPTKTVMLNTRLRNGRISNQPEDVVYWKPGWVVPDKIAESLYRKHSKTLDADLVILSDEKGCLICQVSEKKSSHQIQPEGHKQLNLAPDEVIKLKTRMYNGLISYDVKHVEISDKTWRVPKEIADGLKRDYRTTPQAELFIVCDSKGNLRCIVKFGPSNRAFNFINKKAGTNIFL